jgi:ankyrin repeat protein
MTAARTGNPAVVGLLLDHGADVNARESQLGETALMWAAAENHPEVVRLLVQHGAAVNTRSTLLKFPRDRFGLEGVLTILPRGNWTPLMYAAREGAPDAARELVERGSELNAVDPDGTTALVRAMINAHYDTAGVLIGKGADPNIADTAGMAALYAAVDMSSLGEVYGRPARKVNDKLTALDIIERLLAHGAKPNTPLRTAALQRNHTPGEPLLGEGTTPLMRAARNGDAAAMKILLEHGADATMTQKNRPRSRCCGRCRRGLGVFAKDVGTEADLLAAAGWHSTMERTSTRRMMLARRRCIMRLNPGSIRVQLWLIRGAPSTSTKQGHPARCGPRCGGRGRAGGPAPTMTTRRRSSAG